ncbi:DsrE family protein [Sphingopyxis sp. OPL5]|uniref:DsrE family protein n=1 Tax=Sphingopyxis sp. OPL5 TaxID=2486273 RepID=UPI00223B986A|nr:DsrE family protein [Sphingopyxis sp. OPL5]
MPDVPGLSIIVAGGDDQRFYGALETAMAATALGSPTRIFLQGEAVALLRERVSATGDAPREAAGMPGLAPMIEEAAAMEIELFVCQSGMALVGLTAEEMVPQAKAAGLVSFLREVGAGDRLVVY